MANSQKELQKRRESLLRPIFTFTNKSDREKYNLFLVTSQSICVHLDNNNNVMMTTATVTLCRSPPKILLFLSVCTLQTNDTKKMFFALFFINFVCMSTL